jgi:hypothetical protein
MNPRIIANAIVFKPSDLAQAKQVRTCIPAARFKESPVGVLCAVPLTLESARILRNLGVEAPSPIEAVYNWPIIPGRKPRPHQIKTSAYLTLNPRGHCHNSPRCVDKYTEFLTPSGWKFLPEYVEGDLVAQWNKETDQAEFVEPLEYINMPCAEMIHFTTTKGIDQMLTENHRVIYHDPKGVIRERTAGYIHNQGSRKKEGWAGKIPVTFRAAHRPGIDLSDAQIRTMVAVMADGSFPSPAGFRCVVNIKKERKKERLRELLEAADIPFSERSRDFKTAQGFTRFTFHAPRREKEFTNYWWDCTEDQLKVVIDEAQHWDGSQRGQVGSFEFSTRVRATADFIQYAAVATKRKCSVNIQKRNDGKTDLSVFVQQGCSPIRLTKNKEFFTPNSKKVPAPGGRCYCFSVPSTYIIFRRNGCVFISGNTGKTISTLWSIDYLQQIGVMGKALVVAPLSTLERAWGDEIFLNFPGKKFAVLHGSAEKRRKLLATDQDIYVINHDGVEILQKELMARGDIDLIVIDEVAVFRNAKTKRWKAMNAVVNNRGVYTWCWGLTGTPTSNEPTDAYGQAKLVRPESVKGQSFTAFKDLTMQQFGPFKWVPRKGSEQTVARVLSPSIRFDRSTVTDMEPCLIERHAELSPEQKHHINKLLREAVTEINGSTVSAVNAAVLISKVVQAACISVNTMVLSSRGWVQIQDISLTDKVWDGEAWVAHQGVILKGVQTVVNCGGIDMTPDHEVLTTNGWVTAEEMLDGAASERFKWAEVRLPDGYRESGIYNRQTKAGAVVVPLRLRERGNTEKPELEIQTPLERSTLRMPHRDMADPRDVQNQAVQYMDSHAASMRLPRVQGLRELWRPWYNSLRTLGKLLRGFLARYAGWVPRNSDIGAKGQRWPLLPGELQMGDTIAAVEQQTIQCGCGDPERHDDNGPSCTGLRNPSRNAVREGQSWVGTATSADNACAVYDILNCGPRSRFVVKGTNGEIRIVHNCGVVYGANGEFLRLDFGPRMKVLEEAIEENDTGKVIVFLPFTGALNAVATELRKKWSVEVVDGGVSAGKRNQIYSDFQTKKNPHVLVAHPQCMAHGLELTAADLIIFGAPITSNEIYTQACCRIDGGGQKSKIDIMHISATPTERRIYSVVREKGKLQDVVLELLKEGK